MPAYDPKTHEFTGMGGWGQTTSDKGDGYGKALAAFKSGGADDATADRMANEYMAYIAAHKKDGENTPVESGLYEAGPLGIGNTGKLQKKWLDAIEGPRKAAEAAASAKETSDRAGITDNIQKFIDSMGIADPAITAQLQQRAQAQASGMRGKAGLGSVGSYGGGGGLSAMGQQSINAGLDTQYALQRAGLKSQALGVMNQRDISLSQLEQGYAQMQDARDGQKWAAQQNQNQGIGAGIGAAVGALGFFGGPALGAATMSGGASLGAGFAGLASGGGGPSYSAPSSISGNRGFRGGGTGSTGY